MTFFSYHPDQHDLNNVLMLTIGTAIQAVGICNIHAYSRVTEGGTLGLTLLIYHFLHISPALSSLFLNGACFLAGFRRLGKRFLFMTALSCLLYSLFYALLQPFSPLWPSIIRSTGLCSLLGALFIGVGAGLTVRAGGATSGDDALAMTLSSILGCDIRIIYLVSDCTVLLLSLSYIPLRSLGWSFATVLLSGEIIGVIQKL